MYILVLPCHPQGSEAAWARGRQARGRGSQSNQDEGFQSHSNYLLHNGHSWSFSVVEWVLLEFILPIMGIAKMVNLSSHYFTHYFAFLSKTRTGLTHSVLYLHTTGRAPCSPAAL